MFGMTLFGLLFAAWGAVTTALVLAMIYRSVVGFGEEDQIFLNPAEAGLAAHQHTVLERMHHLDRYVHGFGITSGTLLISMIVWIGIDVLRQIS